MSKIKVEKVEIKIGKRTVRLTPDEARDLRDELSELLGDRRGAVAPYKYFWCTLVPCSTGTITVASSATDGHLPTISSSVYADDLLYYDEETKWLNRGVVHLTAPFLFVAHT